MKIVRTLFFIPVLCLSLSTIIVLNGDDSDLPSFLRRTLDSKGQLSMSVEAIQDSSALQKELSAGLPVLDDVPFNKESSSSLLEEIPLEEKQVTKKEKEILAQENIKAIGKNTAIEKKVQKEQIKKSVDQEQEIIEQKSEKKLPVQESIVLSDKEKNELEKIEQEDEEVVFNFENADLSKLVSYVEMLFGVTFVTDDVINPLAPGGKGIAGNKISFKTNKPMNKRQAWGLFLTFLDMAGLSVVQEADPTLYRISPTPLAKKSPIKSFIGIDFELLPDNDTKVRYVYFVKDTPVATLKSVLGALKSSSADILILQELKAFIITDSAYNIKSLMRIIRELDKVSMPQSMSVLKLKRVDASHVKKLYDSLVKTDQPQRGATRLFAPRKSATALYFPENAQMIVEPRTNSLILLGTVDDIKKIEEFVVNNVDVDAGTPYSPLQVYQLKYADATTVANIMNNVTKFGGSSTVAKMGGVRGSDKYLKTMTFTPEKTGNRLVIRGDYEDYLKAKEIIERLDEPQPQVAVEVLILSVGITDIKELGGQLRNSPRSSEFKKDGLLGKNINFQTSGIRLGGDPKAIVTNENESGAKRLLGDLISLVTGSSAGNTVLSLGSDNYGVWGIFDALKTVSNLQVISNPFLMATNKTKATVSLGEIRNVETATIKGATDTQTFSDKEAKLEVEITPQINSDGMIILDLKVTIVEFRDDTAAAQETSARTKKVIDTTTIVADKEVLALGGLIKNKIENGLNKTPILGNIPILGWMFKNKKKSEIKEDLLVLISARIIDPREEKDVDEFTSGHIGDYKSTIKQMRAVHLRRDPIDRAFFDEKKGATSRKIDKLIFKRDKKKEVTGESRKARRRRKRKEKRIVARAEKKKQKLLKRRRVGNLEKPVVVAKTTKSSSDQAHSDGGTST